MVLSIQFDLNTVPSNSSTKTPCTNQVSCPPNKLSITLVRLLPTWANGWTQYTCWKRFRSGTQLSHTLMIDVSMVRWGIQYRAGNNTSGATSTPQPAEDGGSHSRAVQRIERLIGNSAYLGKQHKSLDTSECLRTCQHALPYSTCGIGPNIDPFATGDNQRLPDVWFPVLDSMTWASNECLHRLYIQPPTVCSDIATSGTFQCYGLYLTMQQGEMHLQLVFGIVNNIYQLLWKTQQPQESEMSSSLEPIIFMAVLNR